MAWKCRCRAKEAQAPGCARPGEPDNGGPAPAVDNKLEFFLSAFAVAARAGPALILCLPASKISTAAKSERHTQTLPPRPPGHTLALHKATKI
jgi:hypothetical protein